VAGRIEAGVIDAGEKIKIMPSGQVTKVKTIEKYLENKIKRCYAGESIGITTQEPVFLNRGDVICASDSKPYLTDRFKANVFWMAKQDFQKEQRLTLRCATQETTCKIEGIIRRINSSTLEVIQEDAQRLKSLEVGEVIIKTKKPIVIESFNQVQELGRFVFVVNGNICAGGIITASN